MYLKAGTEFDENTGFAIPHKYQAIGSVNHTVDAHGTDLEWHFSSRCPLDDISVSITEYQLIVLGQEKKVRSQFTKGTYWVQFYILPITVTEIIGLL